MAELKRKWHIKNPHKKTEYNHKRRNNLSENIKSEEISEILKVAKRCYWCGKIVKNDIHLDHYVPISK